MLESAAATGDGRIVVMSSKAHELASWDPENMNTTDEQHYARLRVYGVTKLYNVSAPSLSLSLSLKCSCDGQNWHQFVQTMTAIALQRRLQNVGITVSTVDPGVVSDVHVILPSVTSVI